MKEIIQKLIDTVESIISENRDADLLIIISTSIERAVFTEGFLTKDKSIEELFPDYRIMIKEYLREDYIITEIFSKL